MNQIIMWIMAAGAVAGGVDRLLGNRFGLGKKFEEGFELLGATALSMAGIICLVPLLSKALRWAVVPLWQKLGLDAAMLGGVVAIDMGGYQLAMELAEDVAVGRYAGIVVAATFGCTVSFTIPVGMGMLGEEDRPLLTRGILIGLGCLPVGLLAGGLLCHLKLTTIFVQSLPVLLLSLLLMVGIRKNPDRVVRGFSMFAGMIRVLTTIGLILGAVTYMTGWKVLADMAPLEDAMQVVSSIGIVMLGSLPVAELLGHILRKPFQWIGKRTGMNTVSMTGILMGMVSIVPAIAMMKEMDSRGKVVNGAFAVCAASALAAHMGFTFGVEPELVVPLLAAKAAGGIAGVFAALLFTKQNTTAHPPIHT
jgi:ethanolamine transporter